MTAQRARGRERRVNRTAVAAVLGGVLVLAVAAFAVFRGLGEPSIPEGAVAVVDGAPDGVITREEFDRAMRQAAARAGINQIPEQGSAEYDNLKEAALGDLFDTVWIRGQAEREAISVSDREVERELETIKQQNFRSEREFQQFLESSGFSEEDVDLRVRLQLLSDEIQQRIAQQAPSVSGEEVEEYYEGAQDQFEQPETRDVRLILNRNRARAVEAQRLLEGDSSVANWRRVARELSTDPASRASGGLRPGLTEGLLEQPLDREVFAAEEGEIVGPVRTPLGNYVFQVENIEPARIQPLTDVRDQIRTQLAQQAQQEAFQSFVDDYGNYWTVRTHCADGFVVVRCDNFPADADEATRPAGAPPACYEADIPGSRPPCPAPVPQAQPAEPGTVTLVNPAGTRLPQRPHPPGDTPEAGQAPAGIPPGLLPGG